MPFEFYKLCHLIGLSLLLLAWGGLLVAPLHPAGRLPVSRRLVMMTHGIALLLMLVAGFGMLARLGILWPWPAWVWAKAVVWFALGGGVALARRRPHLAPFLWCLVVALAGSAAYLAIYKPF